MQALERALRNAHAAGDTPAAQRLAAEILRLRSAANAATPSTAPAAAPPAPAGGLSPDMAAALAGGHAEPTVAPDMAGALAEGHGGGARVSPELQAQADVAAMGPGAGRHAAALNQGAGSMLFGVGTPLTAAAAKLTSALPGGGETLSWAEALQYARARRQALKEADPWGTRIGQAAGLAGGIGAARALTTMVPGAARVLAPQQGQGLANAARYTGTGAAAAGVTAANEEGLGAAPGAALAGAVFAPLAVGVVKGAGKLAGAVANRASPERGAFRILAKRLGESVESLEQRFNDFRTTMGRPPRLVEIMQQETAEELAQVGRVRPDAGAIFREAEEAAALARPQEISSLVRAGGPTTSAPAIRARMDPVVEEARDVVGSRVRSTGTAQTARRDVQMDRVMQTIGNHRVPLTQDMVEAVQHPDISGVLPGPLRRQISAAVAQGGDGLSSVSLTVRQWDMVRQALAERAGSGAGQIYGRLRDQVRDYVGAAVPEYAAALREFGRRSDVARGTDAGKGVLTMRAREFADMLRTAGGGTPGTPQRPDVRVSEQAGLRVGARTALANLFSGSEDAARKAMARLAKDPVLRRNVRTVLRPDEVRALERLAKQYGMQIEFGQGVQLGRKVMAQADTEAFVEAVAQSSRGTPARAGVAQGARTKIAEAAGESPQRASRVAQSLAEDPGLQQRLEFALGGREAQRLRRVGALSTTAERNLAAATPAGTQASNRAAQHAADIQKYIGAGVVAWGRASGAMIANIGNWAFQHTSLSKKAAERLARIATDPARAHEAIGRLRAMGVSADEILAMYRDAAVGAGILTGRD